MVRAPARIAALMPSAPWAWAMQYLPSALASSQAAFIISGVSSSAPGSLPTASTAPVAISLMKSAPPPIIALTRARASSGVARFADAEFRADDGAGLGAR